MKLPPYTVPEQDADLWGCGVVLSTPERRGQRTTRELAEEAEAFLFALGREASLAEVVRALDSTPDRTRTALRAARNVLPPWSRSIVHVAHAKGD